MVREGSTVADFGAGSGAYVYSLSRAVGEYGKVFAVDIQKGLLDKLKKESEDKGIKNLEIIWGDVEIFGGTKLRSDSVDAVVVVNVLFQVDSKAGLAREAWRILKNEGKLLIVDWAESFGGMGPQPNMVVDEHTARQIFETASFEFKKTIDAGEHHYGIVFTKKSS